MDVKTRQTCQKILASNRSDDQKLYDVFQQCKDELRHANTELYYALLGWTDAHKRDLAPAASELCGYFK